MKTYRPLVGDVVEAPSAINGLCYSGIELRELWTANSEPPFMPVLQGWSTADYLRCADMYEARGVRLPDHAVVGLGSVCRRQSTLDIGRLVDLLYRRLTPAPADHPYDFENSLHGFGVKTSGLRSYGSLLGSVDSMAWSRAARYRAALPGCTHTTCANCMRYALRWRERILTGLRIL